MKDSKSKAIGSSPPSAGLPPMAEAALLAGLIVSEFAGLKRNHKAMYEGIGGSQLSPASELLGIGALLLFGAANINRGVKALQQVSRK